MPLYQSLKMKSVPRITTDTAKALARALGVSIDYLVGTWEESEGGPEAAALAIA
jgi:hypothetical protein